MTASRTRVTGPAVVLLLTAGLFAALPTEPAPGTPTTPAAEVRWLEEHSMLRQARDAAATVSGKPVQWRHRYGTPQPREAVRHASVWLLDYPGSASPGRGSRWSPRGPTRPCGTRSATSASTCSTPGRSSGPAG